MIVAVVAVCMWAFAMYDNGVIPKDLFVAKDQKNEKSTKATVKKSTKDAEAKKPKEQTSPYPKKGK